MPESHRRFQKRPEPRSTASSRRCCFKGRRKGNIMNVWRISAKSSRQPFILGLFLREQGLTSMSSDPLEMSSKPGAASKKEHKST